MSLDGCCLELFGQDSSCLLQHFVPMPYLTKWQRIFSVDSGIKGSPTCLALIILVLPSEEQQLIPMSKPNVQHVQPRNEMLKSERLALAKLVYLHNGFEFRQ